MGYSDSRYDNGMDDDERDRRPNGRERAADRASRRQRSNTNGTGSRGTSIKKSATEHAIDAGLRFGGIGQSRADRENPDGFAGENFFRSPEEVIARNNSRPNRWGQKVGGFASGQLDQPLDLPEIEENSPEPFSDPNAGDPNAGVFSGEVVPTNNSFQGNPQAQIPGGFDGNQFDQILQMKQAGNRLDAMGQMSPLENMAMHLSNQMGDLGDYVSTQVPGVSEVIGFQQDLQGAGDARREALIDGGLFPTSREWFSNPSEGNLFPTASEYFNKVGENSVTGEGFFEQGGENSTQTYDPMGPQPGPNFDSSTALPIMDRMGGNSISGFDPNNPMAAIDPAMLGLLFPEMMGDINGTTNAGRALNTFQQ
mgnify:CR=1 FL=1